MGGRTERKWELHQSGRKTYLQSWMNTHATSSYFYLAHHFTAREANKMYWEFWFWEIVAAYYNVLIHCILHNWPYNINYTLFYGSVRDRKPTSQISMLQNSFTTTSKFSCICWCTLGGKPEEHPPPHMHSQVRKHGIHTQLSFTSVNTPQKLVLGTRLWNTFRSSFWK